MQKKYKPMQNTSAYILGFQEIDKTNPKTVGIEMVGGKGASLGELCTIKDVQVPDGFCVTATLYKEIIGSSEEVKSLVGQLAGLNAGKRKLIAEITANIRRAIEAIGIPESVVDEITEYLEKLGEKNAYAVRSSATAEDLPTASFAGQHDTYLN